MAFSVLLDSHELNDGTNFFVTSPLTLPGLARNWNEVTNYADGSAVQVAATTKGFVSITVPLMVVNTTMAGLDGNLDDLMVHLAKATKTFVVSESTAPTTLYSATIGYSPMPDIVIDDLFLLRFKARMVLELVRTA